MPQPFIVTCYGRHNTRLASETVTAGSYTQALAQITIPTSTVRLWVGMAPTPQSVPGVCGQCGKRSRKCWCVPGVPSDQEVIRG